MVSIYSKKVDIQDETINILELRGLSKDTKPTAINGEEVGNGSVYIEIDTQKVYFYDADSQTWKEV